MARERRFASPAKLRREIEAYFRSISRTACVTERVATGEFDSYGHAIIEERPVKNDAGEVITRLEYMIAPRMSALRLYLGISAATWGRYACGDMGRTDEEREEFIRVCESARDRIEDWLRGEKLTRTKGLAGVMHELELNYGDTVEHKITVEGSGRLSGGQEMSLTEVEALLRELGIPGLGNVSASGEGGEEK